MTQQLFLDTGILLRVLDPASSTYSTIRSVLRNARRNHFELNTAIQNIAEFWNVFTRPTSAHGGYGYGVDIAKRNSTFFIQHLNILTEDMFTFQQWQELVVQYGITGTSVHDARLVAIMLERGISDILTLNPTDFRRYDGIKSHTPTDMLAQFAE